MYRVGSNELRMSRKVLGLLAYCCRETALLRYSLAQ